MISTTNRNKKIRVLHVSDEASPYGIGRLVNDLVQAEIQIGHVSPSVSLYRAGSNLNELRATGASVKILDAQSARDPRIVSQYRRLFRDTDIVNFHSYDPLGVLAARLSGKAAIFTFHGALGLHWHPWLLKAYYRLLLERTCRRIVFASNSSVNRYCCSLNCGFNDAKMLVFPYGIEFSNIQAKREPLELREELKLKGKFIVGTAARWDPMKRLDRLIKGYSKLPNRDDHALIIAGSGDEAYRQELDELASHLGISENVRFLGFRADVYDLIKAMDVFVLSSTAEPFGLALLEAMHLGTPSIVFSDGGGPVDIMGADGLIVESPEELGAKLERLMGDDQYHRECTKYVSERCLEFSILKTAARFQQVYENVLS